MTWGELRKLAKALGVKDSAELTISVDGCRDYVGHIHLIDEAEDKDEQELGLYQ